MRISKLRLEVMVNKVNNTGLSFCVLNLPLRQFKSLDDISFFLWQFLSEGGDLGFDDMSVLAFHESGPGGKCIMHKKFSRPEGESFVKYLDRVHSALDARLLEFENEESEK